MGGTVDAFKPSGFPIQEAAGLTAVVCLTVATSSQVHCIIEPARAHGEHGIATFVRALVNRKPLTAELHHLGHERRSAKGAICVERWKNLLQAADFNPIANLVRQ